MSYIPKSMRIFDESMDNFNRNRFRLEGQGPISGVKSGQVITVSLPTNALLHLPSLRMYADVSTTSVGAGADQVFGKLPADFSSLFSRLEVLIGGVAVDSGTPEFNTICRILKIKESNTMRDNSVQKTTAHGQVSDADAVEDEKLCFQDWRGFIRDCATEYMPTEMTSTITLRLTVAPNSVLLPKQVAVAIGTDFTTPGAIANAQQVSFQLDNIYFTCDSVVPPASYNALLRERLQMEPIKINYKSYYTFDLASITAGASTNRFSLSSGSIDCVSAVYRDQSYSTTGIKGAILADAQNTDSFVANYFRFRSYNPAVGAKSMRYNAKINNIQHPQYEADSLEALVDVAYNADKLRSWWGNLITSRASFEDGLFQAGILLNCPSDLGVALKSGIDSSGMSSVMAFQASGQVIPAAGADQADTGAINCLVMVETTQSLVVELGKMAVVEY